MVSSETHSARWYHKSPDAFFRRSGLYAPQVGLEPTTLRLTAECSAIELLRIIGADDLSSAPLESGDDLLSRAVASQVPSARRGLTSVFGMGTGGSLLPLSPEIVFNSFVRSFKARALKTTQEKLTSNLLARGCLPAGFTLTLALRSFAFSPLFRSSPRPISISKLQRYRSFTADLSPYRL